MTMRGLTIAEMLGHRGATMIADSGDHQLALSRRSLNAATWQNFPRFRALYPDISSAPALERVRSLFGPTAFQAGVDGGLFLPEPEGVPLSLVGRRWATGGWLEEFAYTALLEAGADEAVYAQQLRWSGRYGPESYLNEIDVLAREGDRLVFVSAKAARPNAVETASGDDRLFQAMLELDYWRRHFGSQNDAAVLITTADFFEERRRVRHPGLTERAAILDVTLVPADASSASSVVERMRRALATDSL